MKKSVCTIAFFACVCFCFSALLPGKIYGHATQKNHVHIKGKILTPDGQPVQGAIIQLQANPQMTGQFLIDFLTGLSADQLRAMRLGTGGTTGPAAGSFVTTATGDYEIIIDQNDPHITIDIDMIGVDRNKLLPLIRKSDYFFRLK